MVKQLRKISCPCVEEACGLLSRLPWPHCANTAFSDDLPHLGLKVLAQKFPEGLITGSLPASCQQTLPPASARKRSSPKVPPPAAENKWRFTPEDLKKIEYYLEEDQGPADSTSKIFWPLEIMFSVELEICSFEHQPHRMRSLISYIQIKYLQEKGKAQVLCEERGGEWRGDYGKN